MAICYCRSRKSNSPYSHPKFYLQLHCCCSVTKSCLTLQPHGLQHCRLPCPSLSPRVCSDSCSLSRWCHPIIILCHTLLLLPSIFPSIWVLSSESPLFIRWPNIGASASSSVLPMNIQGWCPSNEYSGLISFRIDWFDLLAVQGNLKESSGTLLQQLVLLQLLMLQEHQFFGAQPSLWSNSHIHIWLLEKP